MEIKQIRYHTDQKRWEITFIDSNTSLLLNEETLVHYELMQGKILTDHLTAEIETFDHVQTFYTHALHFLQRRRTTAEVAHFLKNKCHLESRAIHAIITQLTEQKYLDDFAYGKAYIHDQITFQKKSLSTTLKKLHEKGVDESQQLLLKQWFATNETLQAIEMVQLESEIDQQITKLRIYHMYERNQRIIAKMMQKGYNRDAIKNILDTKNEIVSLSDTEKLYLFQKTRTKRQKMKTASLYALYMKQYNIPTEEVIDFFNIERMNEHGK